MRLFLDWSAFYWVPELLGGGKVLVFGDVIDKGGTPYAADVRGVLKNLADQKFEKDGYTLNAADEIEGFLFRAWMRSGASYQKQPERVAWTPSSSHSLPGNALRTFIDTAAGVRLRALKLEQGRQK